MGADDSRAPFLQIPWAARLLNEPGTTCTVPTSRNPKHDTEDSLFAEILKTPRTIRNCISFYSSPTSENDPDVPEVSTLMTIGDGMNGHPLIIHGGMTATLCDESMGMLQGVNNERARMIRAKQAHADGELPSAGVGSFTAELKITYLKPVRTPGCVLLVSKRIKKEGRKEWLRTELRQCHDDREDKDGELVTCAVGEALFITPRAKAVKL